MAAPLIAFLRAELNIRGIFAWLLFTLTTVCNAVLFGRIACFRSVSLCLVLAVTYVGSLYVWHDPGGVKLSRDHAAVIKRRFISVAFASAFAPFILVLNRYIASDFEVNFWEALGFRFAGSLQAVVIPLFLTTVLFSGPLLLHIVDGVCLLYLDARYWKSSFQNYIWLRNHVMAPVTEEFTFRACMMPILIPCFGMKWAILTSPLFFGVAHFHHMMERIRQGFHWKDAVLNSAFQFAYTTIFGIYSAFLFVRTGHFLAPFIVHAFCNHMGFPNFGELFAYKQPLRTVLGIVYVAGLISWYYLLYPLTEPSIYRNTVWTDL